MDAMRDVSPVKKIMRDRSPLPSEYLQEIGVRDGKRTISATSEARISLINQNLTTKPSGELS
jgi:hypothetical protein